jgi:hypothetical protein
VSVNGAVIDVNALENKLNEVYNPSGISWKVSADTYEYSGSTEFLEKGSGLLHTYPETMRTFQNTYSVDREIDDKTAYLFFFNQYGAGEKDRNTDGFMPRGEQFGYIFTQGFASDNEQYIGAAHELGHGKFLLKHPFDNDYKIPALSTNNLMDYTNGATHIAKWQWDLIHDPGVIVRVFEKDKDAEINRTIHLALTPERNLMDEFYILQNGKEIQINVTMYVTEGQYTIGELKYNGKDYVWDSSIKGFINGNEKLLSRKIKINKIKSIY